MTLPASILVNRTGEQGDITFWDTKSVHEVLTRESAAQTLRTTERLLESSGLLPGCLKLQDIRDENGRSPVFKVVNQLDSQARKKRFLSMVIQLHKTSTGVPVLFANDARMGRRWLFMDDTMDLQSLSQALNVLAGEKHLLVWPHGELSARIKVLADEAGSHDLKANSGHVIRLGTVAYHGEQYHPPHFPDTVHLPDTGQLSNLDLLEAESIHIFREAVAGADNPVMLYSGGKDSSVMLHLARKAFYPDPMPFPLLHIDTRWKFQSLYEFRDWTANSNDVNLIVHINPEGVEKDINPFDHGSALHTQVMKTEGLIQALDSHGFDIVLGGARRDEEISRSKERVFSLRNATQRWEPGAQRPEVWRLYNAQKKGGEGIRVFPLSNWTELDIWQYIYQQRIPLPALYFAAERPVVERYGMLIVVDDDRFELFDEEQVQIKKVRFRSLGCYPLSGAVESQADDVARVILELRESSCSERRGRSIDHDSSNAMEDKKLAGYF